MLSKLTVKTMAVACTLGLMLCGNALAQGTGAPASSEPLATSMMNNGWAEASLISAKRDGDRLQVSVRFKASEGAKDSEYVYSKLSPASWETDFYILSENKKYLLMKDSADKPLAPDALLLNASYPQAGSWSATFPAPLAGEKATLYIQGLEPLGPFTVPE